MSLVSRQIVAEYVASHIRDVRVFGDAASAIAAAAANSSSNNNTVTLVGTHNGTFHCDEAMACGLLRHTKTYANANIVRTRNPEHLSQCSIIVDVGSVYDPENNKLDHHQPTFHGTMTTKLNQYKTRLSSVGLVYKHFGKDVMRGFLEYVSREHSELAALMGNANEPISDDTMELIFDAVYKLFVEHIDGIDNGVDSFGIAPAGVEGAHLQKNYIVSTTLSSRVADLQSWWNEDAISVTSNAEESSENGRFAGAMQLTATEFFNAVAQVAFSWLPARSIVERAFSKAASVHPSGAIVVLAERFCPWKEHLMDLEKENNCAGRTLYLLYPEGTHATPNCGWRVQAVAKESSSFESRKALPWRGLRDEELSAASGVPGCTFIHASGFIGGNKSYDGALQMALKALAMPTGETGESDATASKRQRDAPATTN